jgi:hypothetical protein
LSKGEGPRLDALNDPAALQMLWPAIDHAILEPVYETIARVRQDLPPAVAFLGFCGAPWTLVTYMIAGPRKARPNAGAPVRLSTSRRVRKFIDVLVDAFDSVIATRRAFCSSLSKL